MDGWIIIHPSMQCGRPESKVNDDVLEVIVESDPPQSAYELSLKFGGSKLINSNQNENVSESPSN